MPKDGRKEIHIFIEPELKLRLQKIAKVERRTLMSQIVAMLDRDAARTEAEWAPPQAAGGSNA